jgi:1,2-dihydroxy-3-keto-5-methylthiopentene dioxygenase
MSHVQLEDGTRITDPAGVARELAPLGVRLERAPTPTEGEAAGLLDRAALDDAQKERALALLDPFIEAHVAGEGFTTRDMIVLHDGIPGLPDLLAPFARCHRHDDHETRWIVDGEGTFGFVKDGGAQLALTVVAGDFIQVPKGTEHWFVLTDKRRIKAVRHFVDKSGWVPRYTDTAVRVR